MQTPNLQIDAGSQGHVGILREILHKASAAGNLEEVLESIIAGTLELARADSGIILLWNELGDVLEAGASVNMSAEARQAYFQFNGLPYNARLLETARSGESWQIQDDGKPVPGLELPAGVRAVAATALTIGNQVIGVLVLHSSNNNPLGTEDQLTLELVCSFVGFQIQAARQAVWQLAIEEELLKGARYLECIAGVTSQLLAVPYPETLLAGIISWLRSATRVSRCIYAGVEKDAEGRLLLGLKHVAAAEYGHGIEPGASGELVPWEQCGIRGWLTDLAAGDHICGEFAQLASPGLTYPHLPDCNWLLVLPVLVHGDLVAIIGFEETGPGDGLGEHEIALLRGVSNALSSALERTEAERELAAAYDHLENILQSSTGQAIIATDLNFFILHYNSVAQDLLGYTRDEAIGRSMLDTSVFTDLSMEAIGRLVETIKHEGIWEQDVVIRTPAADELTVSVVVSGMVGTDGVLYGYTVFCRDVSELRLNERQLVERQRMESVGLLAGGIAHDFNNILMGILGYASLAKDRIGKEHEAFRMISIIEKSAERAATLTRELLAYARGGKSQSTAVQIDEQVEEILAIVSTNLPKGVAIEKHFERNTPYVKADPAQLQQVIMNLCINAGDAISQKADELDSPDYTGRISLSTSVIGVSNRDRLRLGLQDNPADLRYVCLQVEDTGIGMDQATIQRIFEPFFTTKITGRGLGLSAVDGIIRNHGGCLNVESTPGVGSKFIILLPEDPTTHVEVEAEAELTVPRGSETILVVDDEEINRQLALLTLTNVGYEVLLAANGREGLDVYRQNSERISLVLLDLTMPGLSVESVLGKFCSFEPQVPVILTSGFDRIRIRQIKGTEQARGFLQKPYAPDALARAVRKILDNDQTASTGQPRI